MAKTSRRYEFDVASGTASFRYHGKGKPSAAFCAAMNSLVCAALAQIATEDRACAALSQIATEDRACDPRVGDRFIGRDEMTVVEITAVRDVSALNAAPGTEQVVEYKDSRSATPPTPMFIGYFRTMAVNAIRGGHTFHAVEDDEE